MRYIKKFESQNRNLEIDPNIFMDQFYEIIDEYGLIKLPNNFLNKRGFSISTSNFPGNGYIFRYNQVSDINSTYYPDREAKFSFNMLLNMIPGLVMNRYTQTPAEIRNIGPSFNLNNNSIFDTLEKHYPNIKKNIDTFQKNVENALESNIKGFGNVDAMVRKNIYTDIIPCSNMFLANIRIVFNIYDFNHKEKEHKRTIDMLKKIEWDDNIKSELKKIGFDLD